MKTSFFITAFCILSLSVFLIWNKVVGKDHSISVSVTEDEETYTFAASFNPADTRNVWQYINREVSPNSLGKSENDYFDVNTSLADKTAFYIKESPGKLKIKFDKRTNTTSSYYRIKRMCDGIKDILGGK